MAKSADKVARAEEKTRVKELARLEKQLGKARAVETKRTRKAEKASARVEKLTDRVAARRDPSPPADAADAAAPADSSEDQG